MLRPLPPTQFLSSMIEPLWGWHMQRQKNSRETGQALGVLYPLVITHDCSSRVGGASHGLLCGWLRGHHQSQIVSRERKENCQTMVRRVTRTFTQHPQQFGNLCDTPQRTFLAIRTSHQLTPRGFANPHQGCMDGPQPPAVSCESLASVDSGIVAHPILPSMNCVWTVSAFLLCYICGSNQDLQGDPSPLPQLRKLY